MCFSTFCWIWFTNFKKFFTVYNKKKVLHPFKYTRCGSLNRILWNFINQNSRRSYNFKKYRLEEFSKEEIFNHKNLLHCSTKIHMLFGNEEKNCVWKFFVFQRTSDTRRENLKKTWTFEILGTNFLDNLLLNELINSWY